MASENWWEGKPLETYGLLNNRLAVLLIDMQKYFVKNIIPKAHMYQMIDRQKVVIRECAKNNVPVVVLECVGYGRTIRPLMEELCVISDLELVRKHCDSGFERTDLDDILKGWGRDNLFLMGVNASACVKRTAFSALSLGYSIATSRSVIGTGIKDHPKDLDFRWYQKKGQYFP